MNLEHGKFLGKNAALSDILISHMKYGQMKIVAPFFYFYDFEFFLNSEYISGVFAIE